MKDLFTRIDVIDHRGIWVIRVRRHIRQINIIISSCKLRKKNNSHKIIKISHVKTQCQQTIFEVKNFVFSAADFTPNLCELIIFWKSKKLNVLVSFITVWIFARMHWTTRHFLTENHSCKSKHSTLTILNTRGLIWQRSNRSCAKCLILMYLYCCLRTFSSS